MKTEAFIYIEYYLAFSIHSGIGNENEELIVSFISSNENAIVGIIILFHTAVMPHISTLKVNAHGFIVPELKLVHGVWSNVTTRYLV